MRPTPETSAVRARQYPTITQALYAYGDHAETMERQRDDARKIAEQYTVKNADMQNEIDRLNWRLSNQSDTIAKYQKIEDDLTERCGKNDELRQLIGQKNAEIVALLEEIAGLKKSESITDGGPAFPGNVPEITTLKYTNGEELVTKTGKYIPCSGMSLRDWFAGLALQGLLASNTQRNMTVTSTTVYAWKQADDMLAARNGKGVA